MSADKLEDVVEHEVLEVIVGWNLHIHNEGSSLNVVRNFIPVGYEKVTTFIIQISDERVNVSPGHEPGRLRIVLAPAFNELVDIVLLDRETEGSCLTDESVHHNSNEQIEEDQGYDYHEGEEVNACH